MRVASDGKHLRRQILLKSNAIIGLIFLFVNYSFAQNTKIEVKENKGKVIGTQHMRTYKTYKTYKLYNKSTKNKILVTSGWLDTTKKITVICGSHGNGIGLPVEYWMLKQGYRFSPFTSAIFIDSSLQPITLRIVDGNLLINADILGFGGTFLAKVRNNKLEVVTGKTFEPFYSSRYFEVFEAEHNLPVLQIELGESNEILLSGLFAFDKGWLIVHRTGGFTPIIHPGKIKKMTKEQQDSLYDDYIRDGKMHLKPIHESQ